MLACMYALHGGAENRNFDALIASKQVDRFPAADQPRKTGSVLPQAGAGWGLGEHLLQG